MHMIRKRMTSVILALLMLCIAVIGGCGPRPGSPEATRAAPFSEENSTDYEHYEEQRLIAQKEFDGKWIPCSAMKSALISLIFISR